MSPFLLHANCTNGVIRCNPGATGIEIIEFIDTIESMDIDTGDRRQTLGLTLGLELEYNIVVMTIRKLGLAR